MRVVSFEILYNHILYAHRQRGVWSPWKTDSLSYNLIGYPIRLIVAGKVLRVKEAKKTPICVIKSNARLAVLMAHRSPHGVEAIVETVGAGNGDERRRCNAVTDTRTAAAAAAMATG